MMITAESKTENVIAAKKAGVSNYIVKPFNAATLQTKMEAVPRADVMEQGDAPLLEGITPEQETLSLQPYFYGWEFSHTNRGMIPGPTGGHIRTCAGPPRCFRQGRRQAA
jgi:DNA-binding response OmpR family regulator